MKNKCSFVVLLVVSLVMNSCYASLPHQQERHRQQRRAALGINRNVLYQEALRAAQRSSARNVIHQDVYYNASDAGFRQLPPPPLIQQEQFSFDRFSTAIEQNDGGAVLQELLNSDVGNILDKISSLTLQQALDAMTRRLYVDAQCSVWHVTLWHGVVQRFITVHKTSTDFFLNAAVSHGDLVLTSKIMESLELSHQRASSTGAKAKLFGKTVTRIGRLLVVAIEKGHLNIAWYLYTGAYANPLQPHEFIARAASWLSYVELDAVRRSAQECIKGLEARCSDAAQASLNETAQKLKSQLASAHLFLNTLEVNIKHKISMR